MYRIYKNILHSFQGDFKILVKSEFYCSFPGVTRMIREVSHVCINLHEKFYNATNVQGCSYLLVLA